MVCRGSGNPLACVWLVRQSGAGCGCLPLPRRGRVVALVDAVNAPQIRGGLAAVVVALCMSSMLLSELSRLASILALFGAIGAAGYVLPRSDRGRGD